MTSLSIARRESLTNNRKGLPFVSGDVNASCNVPLRPWQVNGYVVNLFWAFDTHAQEQRTLNFQGSMLSHRGSTLELVGV